MYLCTNNSCAMKGNKLEKQAASALNFQCPVCKQSLQKDRQSDQPNIDVAGFPSIIALPLKEYCEETNPVLKLWHAMRCGRINASPHGDSRPCRH